MTRKLFRSTHQFQRNSNTGGIMMKYNHVFNVSFMTSLAIMLFTAFVFLPGMVNAQESSPEFVEFQSILTEHAFYLESFTIDSDDYFVVAEASDSKIYKWDGVNFIEFQSSASALLYIYASFINSPY